ncbi:DUF2512 family protein [Ornithinibacillus contaminans]|uniref:DUF2512 family protein n=1 Tax=Ornithinibacillus contaminans TaxID=694055 RepID=UPI00064E02D8|nr:DUF2512 family protein [Ornithinibacillus contaminans]
MNYKALGIKLIINIIVVFSIFGIFYDASLLNLFWISILSTLLAYFIGDRILLPRFGNTIATIADFGLAFISLAALGSILIQTDMPIVLAALFAAFFLALTEPFLHTYLIEKSKTEKRHTSRTANRRFQTEFGEETSTLDRTKNKPANRDPRK